MRKKCHLQIGDTAKSEMNELGTFMASLDLGYSVFHRTTTHIRGNDTHLAYLCPLSLAIHPTHTSQAL